MLKDDNCEIEANAMVSSILTALAFNLRVPLQKITSQIIKSIKKHRASTYEDLTYGRILSDCQNSLRTEAEARVVNGTGAELDQRLAEDIPKLSAATTELTAR
ncbi:hypothetical protein YC2023_073285 [Brassica napus]